LPDGEFEYQISHFWYVLEGLGMKNFWYLLWPFGILCGFLLYFKAVVVYFLVNWNIFYISVHCTEENLPEMERIFKLIKQPTYTPAGFDLTTHNSAGGDDTTRPRRNGMERHDYFLQIQFGAVLCP
jgi:hypothetical protein